MDYRTNIWHQRLVAILGSRNLYLRTVYAHIANYTVARGAWCGTQRELAAQLELPTATVNDQIDKLKTMGLVVQNGDSFVATKLPNTSAVQENTPAVQTNPSAVQMRTGAVQKNTPTVQNPTPINEINMNETNLTHAPIVRDENQAESSNFKCFVEAFNRACNGRADWQNRAASCERDLWAPMPLVKKKAILRALAEQPCNEMNPYFFLLHFPTPEPEFLSGQAQERNWRLGIPMVQVKYNDHFLICTKQTQLDFNLDFQQDWLERKD